jgi:hypothetical protein
MHDTSASVTAARFLIQGLAMLLLRRVPAQAGRLGAERFPTGWSVIRILPGPAGVSTPRAEADPARVPGCRENGLARCGAAFSIAKPTAAQESAPARAGGMRRGARPLPMD